MMNQIWTKSALKAVVLTAVTLSVSGCFGPTYGTGKTSGETLVDDLATSFKLGKPPQAPIDYKPRAGIVEPASTATLPAPQESIAESSTEWPETPAQKRARVLADIEAGKRPSNFVTNKEEAAALGASEGPGRNSIAGQRIYLTDPPLDYRKPAETAAVGELGETEAKKAKLAKKAQNKDKPWWKIF